MKSDFAKKHILIVQMLKFCVVGTSAFLLDTAIFSFFAHGLNINSYVALAIAFVLTLFYNYFMSTKWVFENSDAKGGFWQIQVFALLSAIGLLLTEVIYGALMNYVSFPSSISADAKEMFSKIFSSLIVMVYNFITRKLFLERG